jgi:hypothetical protein
MTSAHLIRMGPLPTGAKDCWGWKACRLQPTTVRRATAQMPRLGCAAPKRRVIRRRARLDEAPPPHRRAIGLARVVQCPAIATRMYPGAPRAVSHLKSATAEQQSAPRCHNAEACASCVGADRKRQTAAASQGTVIDASSHAGGTELQQRGTSSRSGTAVSAKSSRPTNRKVRVRIRQDEQPGPSTAAYALPSGGVSVYSVSEIKRAVAPRDPAKDHADGAHGGQPWRLRCLTGDRPSALSAVAVRKRECARADLSRRHGGVTRRARDSTRLIREREAKGSGIGARPAERRCGVQPVPPTPLRELRWRPAKVPVESPGRQPSAAAQRRLSEGVRCAQARQRTRTRRPDRRRFPCAGVSTPSRARRSSGVNCGPARIGAPPNAKAAPDRWYSTHQIA